MKMSKVKRIFIITVSAILLLEPAIGFCEQVSGSVWLGNQSAVKRKIYWNK